MKTSGKRPPARNYYATCCISDSIPGHHPLLMVVGGLGAGMTVFYDVWLLDMIDGTWNEVCTCISTSHIP